MSQTNTGLAYDRPAEYEDIKIIFSAFHPHVQLPLEWIRDIYAAITDAAFSKACVLVVISELVWRFKMNMWGHSKFGAMLPFSAMEFGGKMCRFQTPTMEVVRDAMLSFILGERNVKLLNGVLGSHGMVFVTCHDYGCGIFQTPVAHFLESKEYTAINTFHSYGEGVGTEVVKIQTWEELPREHDLGRQEMISLESIEKSLSRLPRSILIPPRLIELGKAIKYLRSGMTEEASAA